MDAMIIRMTERAVIRPYRPDDRDALADVCVRTAELGGDARGLYRDDELMATLFAEPYAVLEPDLAFVVDDGDRVVGYVVGTADTPEFVRRFAAEWLPRVQGRYPAPTLGVDGPQTPDEVMLDLLHRPERMLHPDLVGYPAHLHIDLLPSHQRAGYGRELMAALLTALHRKGVARVHLGMVTANTPARAFYDRLGFHVIPVTDPGPLTYLGRDTAEPLR